MQSIPKTGALIFASGESRLVDSPQAATEAIIATALEHAAGAIAGYTRGALRQDWPHSFPRRVGRAAERSRALNFEPSIPVREGCRTTIEIRRIDRLGQHDDIGRIVFKTPKTSFKVDLAYCHLEEGSIRLKIAGVVGSAALTGALASAGAVAVDVYNFHGQMGASQCVSEVRVAAITAEYASVIMSRLPPPPVPKSEEEAEQVARAAVRNDTTCIYQSLLGEEMKDRDPPLRADGIWGPETLKAWDTFKSSIGKHVEDRVAADMLLQKHRGTWGPLGAAVDAAARRAYPSKPGK